MPKQNLKKEYWQKNLQYLAVLLGIWFMVSYGFSILLVDVLDKYMWRGHRVTRRKPGDIFFYSIIVKKVLA